MKYRYAYKTSDGVRLAASRTARSAWRPCRRTADCTAIARFKRVREPTSVTKAHRNVLVERRISPKFVADAPLRVKDKDRNLDVIADGLHYGSEISVARNKNERFGASFIRIAKHSICDVYIRHLLRDTAYLYAPIIALSVARYAGFADGGEEFGLFAVATFDDFDARAVGKCVEILPLPLGTTLIDGLVDYARCKVFDGVDDVIWTEKFFRELFKVKPLVDTATELSVIEVASVNVDYCFFHSQTLKVQGPESLPAPRRLPESRRVKRPVIGGTWNYTKSPAVM